MIILGEKMVNLKKYITETKLEHRDARFLQFLLMHDKERYHNIRQFNQMLRTYAESSHRDRDESVSKLKDLFGKYAGGRMFNNDMRRLALHLVEYIRFTSYEIELDEYLEFIEKFILIAYMQGWRLIKTDTLKTTTHVGIWELYFDGIMTDENGFKHAKLPLDTIYEITKHATRTTFGYHRPVQMLACDFAKGEMKLGFQCNEMILKTRFNKMLSALLERMNPKEMLKDPEIISEITNDVAEYNDYQNYRKMMFADLRASIKWSSNTSTGNMFSFAQPMYTTSNTWR